MKLLPYYTKRQIEIAEKINEYRENYYSIGILIAELEFQLQPIVEKIAKAFIEDKEFIKALRKLKNENNRQNKISHKVKNGITKSGQRNITNNK